MGKHDRSIAERHRMIVLLASVFMLLPVGASLRIVVNNPGLRILATLLLSFGLTALLTFGLRRQFLLAAATSDWTLRPTTRPVGRHCSAAVQQFSTAGFAVSDVVVVANEAGQTMTRPMALMHRHNDRISVTAHSLGSHAMTMMCGGWWLVTSSTGVVRHPELLVQPARKRDPLDVLRVHTSGLEALAAHGLTADVQPSPFDSALRLEQMEQETLRSMRSSGTSAPRNTTLADRGRALTLDDVADMLSSVPPVKIGASPLSPASCAILRE